jgi:hypothetical protein
LYRFVLATFEDMQATYSSAASARQNFKQMLDGAAAGVPVTVRRDKEVFALTQADKLRRHFAETTSPRLRLGQEDGVWIASMDHRPFVAEGRSEEEAIYNLVEDLREYAEDWAEHYEAAPRHKREWGLVQLVSLSTDSELVEWLCEGAR